jgi:toxin HigB-1
MYLPRFPFHPLEGEWEGRWAVSVSGSWRVTFRFEGGDAYDVDLLDYH